MKLDIPDFDTPGPKDSPMEPITRAKLIVLSSGMVESWLTESMPNTAPLFASCRFSRNRDTRTAVMLHAHVIRDFAIGIQYVRLGECRYVACPVVCETEHLEWKIPSEAKSST